MKLRYIFIFSGVIFLSAHSATAGNLSANPWLKENHPEKTRTETQQRISNYDSRPAVTEETPENPWQYHHQNNSVINSGLRQNISSAAQNYQKNLQILSDRLHRPPEQSDISFQEQNKEYLPNIVGKISELMHSENRNQPTDNTSLFNYDSARRSAEFQITTNRNARLSAPKPPTLIIKRQIKSKEVSNQNTMPCKNKSTHIPTRHAMPRNTWKKAATLM